MSPKPNVAIHLPTRWGGEIPSMDELTTFCRRSDELGFHSLWVYDMILYNVKCLDPLTTLAIAAAHTKQIKLGVNCLLLSLRQPVGVAKAVGTLDALAGGRTILAVALGGRDNEYVAMNTPQKERVGRLEEGIEVLRKLWTENNVNYHGKYFHLEDAIVEPKPAAHVPLLVGATSEAGMRRAARIGDGWTRGGRGAPEEFGREWQFFLDAAKEYGRDTENLLNCKTLYVNVDADRDKARRELEEHFDAFRNPGLPQIKDCVYGTPADMIKVIKDLGDVGCQTVALGLPWPDSEKLELIAKEVLPAFK